MVKGELTWDHFDGSWNGARRQYIAFAKEMKPHLNGAGVDILPYTLETFLLMVTVVDRTSIIPTILQP